MVIMIADSSYSSVEDGVDTEDEDCIGIKFRDGSSIG